MYRPRLFLVSLAAVVLLLAVFAPGWARAEGQTWTPGPLYVLTVSTDDADDEADGLTQALRAYVRAMPGWSLGETPQSFETLAIALRCPRKPDASCLQRIGDQLRAQHYVWGTLARGGRGEVKAEVHLWKRDEAEASSNAVYSDLLKDGSDVRLRAIVKSLFEKLTGARMIGAIVVRAPGVDGDVFVDGVARGSLERGNARVVVAEGTHSVDVRGQGATSNPQTVLVVGGGEQTVTFGAPSEAGVTKEPDVAPRGSIVRPVLGYSAVGVGAALLAVAVVEAVSFEHDKSASEDDRSNVPSDVRDVCTDSASPAAADACAKGRDARTVSMLGWVFGAAGAALAGTGVWLLLSPSHSEPSRPATAKSPIRVLPRFDAQERSLEVQVSF